MWISFYSKSLYKANIFKAGVAVAWIISDALAKVVGETLIISPSSSIGFLKLGFLFFIFVFYFLKVILPFGFVLNSSTFFVFDLKSVGPPA